MSADANNVGRERIEALSRLWAGIAVTGVCLYTLGHASERVFFQAAVLTFGALSFVFASVCLLIEIKRRPALTMKRNVLSITLDVVAISGALYMGAGLVDPIALFYLWVIVGSGLVYGIRYLFVATLLAATGFGLVYLGSPYWQAQPMFSATVAGLMLLLAPYLATLLVSLERAQKQVTWQANHDGLTELMNRRAFERGLDQHVLSTQAEHFLLYLDLDRFKEINDTAGHAAGDQVLQDIAVILRSHAHGAHVAARMGGDEFCLLLKDESLENARRCAESIRSEIASYRLAWGTDYYTLGVSIGVVSSTSSTDGDSLVRLADAACYAAKNNGRNQVHVVDPHSEDTDTQIIRRLRLPGAHAANSPRLDKATAQAPR
jgi:diguanylate cyclase (GGDEF)-like protein